MKKIITIVLTLAVAFGLVACGKTSSSSSEVAPEVTPKDYVQILQDTRSTDLNDAYHIIADGKVVYSPKDMEMDEEQASNFVEDTWLITGLNTEDMQEYAISCSLINIRAYATMIVKPQEGKTDAVKAELENYISNVSKSFENYLQDQYEIAKAAEIRTTANGEIIVVMAEDAKSTADAIEKALA